MHVKLTRDQDGRPVDALHIHGYAPREDSLMLEKAIWAGLGEGTRTARRPRGALSRASAASRWRSLSFSCCTT